MKRIGLVVGVLVLSLGLMLGQTGISQMGQMGPGNQAATDSPISIQMETHLLRAISEAGLDVSQLQQIETVIGNVQSANQTLTQRQQELRGFLYGWQGNPDELEDTLEPYEQALDEARAAYQDARQSAVTELQSVFTIAQGRAFLNALRDNMGPNAQGTGPMNGPMMGQGNRMGPGEGAPVGNRQMMGGMHKRMQGMHAQMQGGSTGMSQGGMQAGMAQRHAQMMGRMQGQANQAGGMHANCPMMNRQGQMGAQHGMQGLGAGLGPMFLAHLDLWQQVIGEKLDRLQGESR